MARSTLQLLYLSPFFPTNPHSLPLSYHIIPHPVSPPGRLFVERYAHQEFLERMVEEVAKMKVGDPLDRSVAHGPQNHK